jgi:putative hemolysin
MTWFIVACCLLVSFIFSGIEAGILSMNRVRLRHRMKLRDRAALRLNALLAHPERLLVTVLVVTNLANIFAVTLTTAELVRLLGRAGWPVAMAIFLPVYLIGVELLPKSLFRRFPYRALAALAGLLQLADLLLWPLHTIGRGISHLLFGRRPPDQQKLFVAREDFKYLTIESERSGALTNVERRMIHNVVDFRTVTAKDVMLPMDKVRTIDGSAPVEELLRRYREVQLDRWPVCARDGGAPTGLVNVLDLALDLNRRGAVENYQRRIVKISPNESAYTILHKMRAARSSMAAVLDTGGQPLGMVTWEDLIRRLVSSAATEEKKPH